MRNGVDTATWSQGSKKAMATVVASEQMLSKEWVLWVKSNLFF